jgi:hypothetical protein
LLPVTGPLPQISHTFAMFFSFYPIPRPRNRPTVECMNGLLVNDESESALLTSFMLIGKYFYINLRVTHISQNRFGNTDNPVFNLNAKKVVPVSKKCLTLGYIHVPRDFLPLQSVGMPHSLFLLSIYPE